VTKKRYFLQPECTFAELGIEFMVAKLLQDNTKMLLMLLFILGVDQDVINKDHDKLVQLQHEYEVHQVHKICRSIGESKQHNQILIQSIPSGEASLRNIF
jgi:dynactin complex subunit